ncbi:MAG: sugar phosphate isomerase/epimerase [Gammaproteobacteria bacterium]|nr:sugar phosphate isomerase/epimerase [Gammaproteobacteria bacterium]
MKIGYRTVSFSDRAIEDALDVIAEAGYNAVELCLENPDLNPETLTAERARELRLLCESKGLSIAAVSYHGVDDQPEVRRQRTYPRHQAAPRIRCQGLRGRLPARGSRRDCPRSGKRRSTSTASWPTCARSKAAGWRSSPSPGW